MLTQSTGLHEMAGRMIDLSAYRGSVKAAGALQRLQEIESMASPHN